MRQILHFAQDSDTSGFFPQLARRHDRTRYRMTFATLHPTAPWLQEYMEAQGVACFSCGCRSKWQYPLGVLRLFRFLRRGEFDVLHVHLFWPSVVGLLAGYLARVPIRVMTRHYSDYHTRINKQWHVRLDQLCTGLSGCVIAVSEHTAQVMRDEEGAPASRLRVILNGVDFDRVRVSSPEAPAKLRQEFAPNGEFLLLQVGRLHPEKGYEHLFRAMPLIRRDAGRPVRLLVAGAGPFEDAYREMVRELGIEDLVTFLGFRRDAPELMAAADLLVLASVAEAFGLVLTEALYLGVPVVATRVGGIPEIITDGVDGLLVPPASPEALADAVTRVVRDNALRSRLAGAGREKVAQSFSFEDMVGRYETVYDDLFQSQGKRGEVDAPRLGSHSNL